MTNVEKSPPRSPLRVDRCPPRGRFSSWDRPGDEKDTTPPFISVGQLQDYVGQEIGLSPWVTIGQGDIDDFARLTRDDQWIHIDRERATRERGGTVAHGFLTLSFLSYLARSMAFRISGVTHGVNYGFDRLRFTSFVPSGARVRLRQTLTEWSPSREAWH